MKATRKVLMSVLTLILTVFAVTTITVAWFSLSTVSQINEITGTVRGGDGLEVRLVSTDGTKKSPWKNNLSKTDIDTFLGQIKETGFELTAVSTTNVVHFTKMKEINGKPVVNGEDAVANTDYLQFKIQFRSAEEGTIELQSYELYSTENLYVFEPEGQYYQFEATNESDDDIYMDPSNGARIGLKGTIGTGGALKAYQKPAANYTGGPGGPIKGNTANDEPVVFGQYSYLNDLVGMKLYYKEDANDIVVSDVEIVGETADADYKLLSAITFQEAAVEVGTEIVLVKNEYVDDNNENQIYIADANEDYVAELEITIWLEGWDADTYDVLYNTVLFVDLVFNKKES